MVRKPLNPPKSGSFADDHPILAVALIIGFLVFALIPALAIISEDVACALGAIEEFCPAEAEPDVDAS